MQLVNGFPRRIQLDQMTPAELAIRQALIEVEKSGCAPELTDIVVALCQVQSKLADWIERDIIAQQFAERHDTIGVKKKGAFAA